MLFVKMKGLSVFFMQILDTQPILSVFFILISILLILSLLKKSKAIELLLESIYPEWINLSKIKDEALNFF